MDIAYGNVYCFACNDYIFDNEFGEIARIQSQIAVTKKSKVNYELQPSHKEEECFYTFGIRKWQIKGYSGKK